MERGDIHRLFTMDIKWNWEDMCGPGGLHPWNPKIRDMGYCFQRLFIVIPTLFLLAIVSSFYVGRRIHWVIRGKLQERAILLRCLAALAMSIIPLIRAYKILNNELDHTAAIDYFTCCTESIAWFIHFCYILALRRRLGISPRGSTILLVLWSITAVMSVVSLRTLVLIGESYALAIVKLVLQIVYALTLLPSEGISSQTYYSPCLVGSQYSQLSEQHPLLHDFIENEGLLGTAMCGVSFLSRLIFHWVTPLFQKGVDKKLKDPDDLFDLPPNLSSSTINRKMERALIGNIDRFPRTNEDNNLRRTTRTYGTINDGSVENEPILNVEVILPDRKYNVSLLKALHVCFAFEFYSIGILKLLADISGFAGPLLLNKLVNFIEDPSVPINMGYLYAAGLLVSSLIGAFCDSHFNMYMALVSLKLRAAIMSTIFKKMLSVTSTELNNKFSVGEMTNFISTDTDRIVNSCPSFHSVWSIPLQLGVTLYLLYTQVGMSFLAGVAFSIFLIPVNKYVANKIGMLSVDLMHHKDERVSLMSEIIKNIRTIKFYVWEAFFLDKIKEVRTNEIKYLRGRKYLDAICVFFWATTPVVVATLTLSTYALLGNKLTAATVFTTLALLNMLIAPLNAFPWVLNGLTEAWVSVKRIQRILDLEDLNEETIYTVDSRVQENNVILSLENVTFRWVKAVKHPNKNKHQLQKSKKKGKTPKFGSSHRSDSSIEGGGFLDSDNGHSIPFHLSNLSFDIKRGDFVGIIGPIGSGKSSLMSGILGEMIKVSGRIFVCENHEGFGYVSQKPWLQKGTVKENILFGKAYEENKYRTVVEACGLTEDLAILGHNYSVGEGGSSLSGGQIARIALARAVYQDKHIYLLDDVLSAVDLKVGMHIYQKCLMGLLKYKTRILITHSVQYLGLANTVISMENGRIKEKGPPNVVFDEMDDNSFLDMSDNASLNTIINDEKDNMDNISLRDDRPNNLSTEETSAFGSIDFWVFKMYWRNIGNWLSFVILLSLFSMQLSRNVTDLWLSYWVTNMSPMNSTNITNETVNSPIVSYNFTPVHLYDIAVSNDKPSVLDDIQNYTKNVIIDLTDKIKNNLQATFLVDEVGSNNNSVTFYLSLYAGFAAVNSIFTFIRAFVFAYGGIQAAISIHKCLLRTVVKGKMGFFDSTPAGRIINRFSSDTYTVDDSLPFILNILLAQVFAIIGSLAITAYSLPWITLIIVPLLPIYHCLQHRYRVTSRELKRISSVTLSPIYTFFNDTIEGLVIIKAFKRTNHWTQNGEHHIERSQKANLNCTAAAQWLGLRLRLMSAAILTGAAIVAVAQRNLNMVDSGLVGLAISYALSLTSLLGGVINAFTETEREMIAVERVGEYIKRIEPDGKEFEGSEEIMPPYGWPNMGIICFKDVVMKYKPHLSSSLKYVSFETYPSEKIGVVGRTGAGKSSLFAALFRLCELQSGSITIDSVDISNLSLMTLRTRIAIIPQDPFIFKGTIRQNLDPLEQHSDDQLWSALEKCGAKYIIRQKGGLNEPASDFSRGHMQLLCLTRAILQNAKILCIDEATANIDYETDRMIQETIRCSFRKSTVITIAHRISTIMDSDRIIVMGDGEILEFDTPENLMDDTTSHFYQLVHQEPSR